MKIKIDGEHMEVFFTIQNSVMYIHFQSSTLVHCVEYNPSLLKSTIQPAENLLPNLNFELE